MIFVLTVRCLRSGGMAFQNHMTENKLCFLTYDNSFSQVNFFAISIHSQLLFVLFEF